MQTPSISIRDIGPIVEFEYALNGYGLHVLRGAQGSGKSTTLRTVQLATDGRADAKPTKRDGTRAGEAEVAGRILKISKTTREEGDLTVDGVGDLNIADLHSPKFLDARTRDRHRIKTLVRLGGVKADASLFYHLVPGGAEGLAAVIAAADLQTDDLVEMAARIKRACERCALVAENKASAHRQNAVIARSHAEGIDTSKVCDQEALDRNLREALTAHAALQQKATSAAEARVKADAAGRTLANMPPGESVEAAEAALNNARRHDDECQRRVAEVESLLEVAKGKAALAKQQVVDAEGRVAASKRESEVVKQMRAAVEAVATLDAPTTEQLEQAAAAVAQAEQAAVEGVRVREAVRSLAIAEDESEAAKRAEGQAERARVAAQGTQEVLTDAICAIEGIPLRVRIDDDGEPRLVLHTDRSPTEPFDDLSDGERWPIIIGIAAKANRLIVMPQAAFGELSPDTRAQIHALAQRHECYVLTAEADYGALRGERWPGTGAAMRKREALSDNAKAPA